MFELVKMKTCGVVKASRGVLKVPVKFVQDVLGALKGQPHLEWAIVMKGTRSLDGTVVEINEWFVPQDQERTGANVRLPSMYESGEYVAVLHSHHSMGAWFSGTDHEQLNGRFPVSMVVSTRLEGDLAKVLGFSYHIEGQVMLPCGSLGVVKFDLEVVDLDGWPKSSPGIADERTVVKEPGDCGNFVINGETGLSKLVQPKCGLIPEMQVLKVGVIEPRDGINSLLPDKAAGQYTWVSGQQGKKQHGSGGWSGYEYDYSDRYYQQVEFDRDDEEVSVGGKGKRKSSQPKGFQVTDRRRTQREDDDVVDLAEYGLPTGWQNMSAMEILENLELDEDGSGSLVPMKPEYAEDDFDDDLPEWLQDELMQYAHMDLAELQEELQRDPAGMAMSILAFSRWFWGEDPEEG